MLRRLRILATCVAVVGLIVATGALADPQGKGKGKGGGAKKHQNMSGKELLGNKIHENGQHKIHDHGKFSAFANVKNGKVAGVNVKHADKGDVKVTKYKTTNKSAQPPTSMGWHLISEAYAQDLYVDTIWIGFAYIDDFGEEIIYWFPVGMVLDGETGAIVYYAAY